MNCPACRSPLKSVTSNGITLDVCTKSCGGVWFDAKELEKFDLLAHDIQEQIVRPIPVSQVVVDRSKARNCPVCPNTVLAQIETSHEIETDQCLSCGGIWLDLGELHALQKVDRKSDEIEKVMREFDQSVSALGGKIPRGLRAIVHLLTK